MQIGVFILRLCNSLFFQRWHWLPFGGHLPKRRHDYVFQFENQRERLCHDYDQVVFAIQKSVAIRIQRLGFWGSFVAFSKSNVKVKVVHSAHNVFDFAPSVRP